LNLSLKRVERVERFALNLEELASVGIATRRMSEKGQVFDMRVYRSQDGEYALGVRREHTVPLLPFACVWPIRAQQRCSQVLSLKELYGDMRTCRS
jgi:hypothetical protein